MTAGGLPGARLRRVIQHIDGNLQRRLSLGELSGVVHMSPYHFARLFKQSTGLSPHRFVIRRRVDHAMTLLADAGRSIETVAGMAGFRTASHFTTTFRRTVGITPSAYRTGADRGHANPERAA